MKLRNKPDGKEFKMTKARWILAITLALAISVLAFGTAMAQNNTLQTPVSATIAEILANPVRDQAVTLSGQVTQVIEGNDFLLDDGTGSIRVDGGPFWHHQLGLTAGQSVTISGEVDLGRPGSEAATPQIDLFFFEADGQTMTVRDAGGPPPWAGGPHRNDKQHGNQGADDDTDDDD
jgi:uncharacterized protein YdeI (BOF family)